METFNLQDFVLSLVRDGGLAVVVSGFIASKFKLNLSGLSMQILTWIAAIGLTYLGSIIGYIPVASSELGQIILNGFANGLIANLLYKSGILKHILEKFGLQTQHQTLL